MLKTRAFYSVVIAIACADAVAAETHSDSASSKERDRTIEEVLVTATRLNRDDVPTPMISVDREFLQEGARANIIAALNDLPQFKMTVTPQSSGSSVYSGGYTMDLRALGPARTLTLFDGHRLVAEALRPDPSMIPTIVIDRVDVVTGSASAAWGSSAVAGVVNFVIDDKLEGLRLNAQVGSATHGDNDERRIEAAAGLSFGGGRGHVLIGGEYYETGGFAERDVHSNLLAGLIPNPTAGQESLIYTTQRITNTETSRGGLILSGLNTGMTFNPDGSLRPYNYGTPVGNDVFVNGEGTADSDITGWTIPPAVHHSVFGRTRYDLSDAMRITADVLYARAYDGRGDIPLIFDSSFNMISSDNAFLSPAIRDQMIAAGESDFLLGRSNLDIAPLNFTYDRETIQGTLGLEGEISGHWNWKAYYTRGTFHNDLNLTNSRIETNFDNAVDSVLVAGVPACRINADADPNNDDAACVPIDLFGEDAPSAAARAYALGTVSQRYKTTLDSGSAVLRGDPFALPAGRVSAALGIEARREAISSVADPISQVRGFATINRPTYNGENTTREGFTEVQVPLLKDMPLLKKLDLNAAARYTDDRTSGIWSWKVGLIDQLTESVQLRFTTSRDIRQPNLTELFQTASPGITEVLDTIPGGTGTGASGVIFVTGGNPALESEASRTITAGLTLTPSVIPDMRLSVDYFDIDIDNAITTLGAQQIVNLCAQGSEEACGAIVRDLSGTITQIRANALNLLSFQTQGFDIGLDYKIPLGLPGTWKFKALVTIINKYETDNGLQQVDLLGSQVGSFVLGVAKRSANADVSYEMGNFQTNLRARYISPGNHDNFLPIENNRVGSYTYIDAGAAYTLPLTSETSLQMYASVSNLLDKAPPVGGSAAAYYDAIGRFISGGVRVRF